MRARTAALAAILAMISCGDESSPAGPTEIDVPAAVAAVPTGNTDNLPAGQGGPVVGVEDVSPRPAPTVHKLIELPAVEVGGTIQLRSTCDTPATWQTSDAAVATVDDGLVTGVAAGRARISETCGGVTSSVSIEVVAAPDVSYAFDPVPPARIDEGATGHFRVNVIRDGRRSRITEGVTSSAPDVLRLNLEGDRWRYTGTGPGSAEIRVTQGGSRRLTHSVRVAGPDYEITNVARYQSSIRVADWLRFTWRARVTAGRFEVRVKFQQGAFHTTCTERWYNPEAGEQERETSIPSVCGTDEQWSSVTIEPADGRACRGCGTFRRSALPTSRNFSPAAETNALREEMDTHR